MTEKKKNKIKVIVWAVMELLAFVVCLLLIGKQLDYSQGSTLFLLLLIVALLGWWV